MKDNRLGEISAEKGPEAPQGAHLVPQLALPHHESLPARARELRPHFSVPLHISRELCAPEVRVRARTHPTIAAAVPVPEAAVHEDDLTTGRKNQVWFSRKFARVQTVSVARSVKEPAHKHFGRRVAAANAGHVEPALFRGEHVCHGSAKASLTRPVTPDSHGRLPGRQHKMRPHSLRQALSVISQTSAYPG